MYNLTEMAAVNEATRDSPRSIVVGKVPSRKYRVEMRKSSCAMYFCRKLGGFRDK